MPLWIADADSQGGIGVMLQMTLGNLLREQGVERKVATVVTQVVVDCSDPAFLAPTKPIGPWYDQEQAREIARQEGWVLREQPGSGWRRVVPSPRPVRIVEAHTISSLVAAGEIVIAAGGGGVPVRQLADGSLAGVDAVIDKDASSALLAALLDAAALVILMAEERVWLGWGTPEQRPVERIAASEARRMLAQAVFAEGSVAPKVAAAATFAERTGRDALICSPSVLAEALAGRAGTRVTAG
jgi:carbamate kinase